MRTAVYGGTVAVGWIVAHKLLGFKFVNEFIAFYAICHHTAGEPHVSRYGALQRGVSPVFGDYHRYLGLVGEPLGDHHHHLPVDNGVGGPLRGGVKPAGGD